MHPDRVSATPRGPWPRHLGAILIIVAALATALLYRHLTRATGHGEPLPTLSVFEPHAGGCVWSKLDLSDPTDQGLRRVAVLPNDCPGARAAWHPPAPGAPPAAEALVWFPPLEEGGSDSVLFLVDLNQGRWRRLPMPDTGIPEAFGWSPDGELIAFVLDHDAEIEVKTGQDRALVRVGDDWVEAPAGNEGEVAVAKKLRFDSDAWRVVESRPTRCCDPEAPGIDVLPSAADLRSPAGNSAYAKATTQALPPETRPTEDPRTLAALAEGLSSMGLSTGLTWLSLGSRDWPRQTSLLLLSRGAGSAAASGPLFIQRPEGVAPLQGAPYGIRDSLRVRVMGRHLLVTDRERDAQPLLYDMQSGQLLWSSPTALAVSPWPQLIGQPAEKTD